MLHERNTSAANRCFVVLKILLTEAYVFQEFEIKKVQIYLLRATSLPYIKVPVNINEMIKSRKLNIMKPQWWEKNNPKWKWKHNRVDSTNMLIFLSLVDVLRCVWMIFVGASNSRVGCSGTISSTVVAPYSSLCWCRTPTHRCSHAHLYLLAPAFLFILRRAARASLHLPTGLSTLCDIRFCGNTASI